MTNDRRLRSSYFLHIHTIVSSTEFSVRVTSSTEPALKTASRQAHDATLVRRRARTSQSGNTYIFFNRTASPTGVVVKSHRLIVKVNQMLVDLMRAATYTYQADPVMNIRAAHCAPPGRNFGDRKRNARYERWLSC